MKYTSVEELPVWQTAHSLTLQVYKLSSKLPSAEQYGLVSQLRRAASSIPANITEGFYRKSIKELLQFLYVARGSLGETKYHLLLARDLDYITNKEYEEMLSGYDNAGKQLNGWINSLKKIKN